VTHKLLDQESAVIQTAVSHTGKIYHHHSGLLDASFEFSNSADDNDGFLVQISASCRTGKLRVETSADIYVVEPGAPLHVIMYPYSPSTVEVSPLDGPCDCEFQVASTGLFDPVTHSAPFLILDAGTGITNAPFSDKISAWRDTRAVSLAPSNFNWSGTDGSTVLGASFIEEDPDFGGRPSVEFKQRLRPDENESGGFVYPSGTTFGFMRGDANWVAMAIVKFNDDLVPKGSLFSDQRFRPLFGTDGADGNHHGVDGGYRPYSRFQTNIATASAEVIEKPCVMIWAYTASNKTMHVYYQGAWRETFVNADASFSTVANVLNIGRGTGTSASYSSSCKLAHFRIYNHTLDDEQFGELIGLAVNHYGIDDTMEPRYMLHPFTVFHMKSCRGAYDYTNKGRVEVIHDSRHETLAVDECFSFQGGQNPTIDDGNPKANGFRSIRFFGGSRMSYNDGPTGKWDRVSGGVAPGATIWMALYFDGNGDVGPIIGMSNYGLPPPLNGTSIYKYERLRYDTDDGTDDDVVNASGSPLMPDGQLVLFVYRLDAVGNAYSIYEKIINSDFKIHDAQNVPYDGTPIATSANTIWLFSSPGVDTLNGGLLEFGLLNKPITNDEIEDLSAYVRHRYTP